MVTKKELEDVKKEITTLKTNMDDWMKEFANKLSGIESISIVVTQNIEIIRRQEKAIGTLAIEIKKLKGNVMYLDTNQRRIKQRLK